jgi:hypothetical protein
MAWPWFGRKSQQPPDGDDWITVPFRFAEAARVSIYTIGARPDIPESVRWWIANWLANYNAHLVHHMQVAYGPDIFNHLDRITREVMPSQDPAPSITDDTWDQWESQFKEEQ